MAVMYWLIAAAAFLICEMITMGLTTIWFAGGALIAALASALHVPLPVQIVLFLAVSLILLVLTRPLAKKYFNNKTVKTNADSLIGQKCIVTKDIDNLRARGQVKVKGQEWTARSYDDDVLIKEDTRVYIERISGVKLIVRPEETPNQ